MQKAPLKIDTLPAGMRSAARGRKSALAKLAIPHCNNMD
jgi:hypothetical protein